MKLHRTAGAVGFMAILGACEVHTQRAQPPPPPPRYYYYYAYTSAPPAPPPPQAPQAIARPAPPVLTQTAPAPPQPVSPRFPTRIVHPLPLENPGAPFLDLQGLQALLRLRPDRKCGPREITGGHWIHLDCNMGHGPIKSAKAFTPDKINMLLQGLLKLDNPLIPGASAGPTPTAKALGGALPDAVDHRRDGTEGPMKDQGQVGACSAFSLSTAMDNAIRRQNRTDTTSTLHLWSHYGDAIMQNAGDKNLKKPIALWEAWPYDERVACELDQSGGKDCGPYSPPVGQGSGSRDPQLQAKIRDSDARGQWEVTEYDQIKNDPDTIAAILATGADVWFSMDIGSTWLHPVGENIVDWTSLNIDGGHAAVFAGYRHVAGQRQFSVHNSWGKTWGDQGYAYVSEAMVRGFIRPAYKVVVANKSAPTPTAPTPTATPVSDLTDDDCGEDQLVDSVTGQCAKICPDDSRPANGKCVRR